MDNDEYVKKVWEHAGNARKIIGDYNKKNPLNDWELVSGSYPLHFRHKDSSWEYSPIDKQYSNPYGSKKPQPTTKPEIDEATLSEIYKQNRMMDLALASQAYGRDLYNDPKYQDIDKEFNLNDEYEMVSDDWKAVVPEGFPLLYKKK